MKEKLRTLVSLFAVVLFLASCDIGTIDHEATIKKTLINFRDTVKAGNYEQALTYCDGRFKDDLRNILTLRVMMPAEVATQALQVYTSEFTVEKIESVPDFSDVAIVVGYFKKGIPASFLFQTLDGESWKIMWLEAGDLTSIKLSITGELLEKFEIYTISDSDSEIINNIIDEL